VKAAPPPSEATPPRAVAKAKPHPRPAPRAPSAAAPSPSPAAPSPSPAAPSPSPAAPSPRPAAPSPSPAATGHLLVGGEGALRAEIRIDGSARGFAPKLLELPIGPHDVELLLGNGSSLQKRITLVESHTLSSPLRWIVP
jgi:hypothetical protein